MREETTQQGRRDFLKKSTSTGALGLSGLFISDDFKQTPVVTLKGTLDKGVKKYDIAKRSQEFVKEAFDANMVIPVPDYPDNYSILAYGLALDGNYGTKSMIEVVPKPNERGQLRQADFDNGLIKREKEAHSKLQKFRKNAPMKNERENGEFSSASLLNSSGSVESSSTTSFETFGDFYQTIATDITIGKCPKGKSRINTYIYNDKNNFDVWGIVTDLRMIPGANECDSGDENRSAVVNQNWGASDVGYSPVERSAPDGPIDGETTRSVMISLTDAGIRYTYSQPDISLSTSGGDESKTAEYDFNYDQGGDAKDDTVEFRISSICQYENYPDSGDRLLKNNIDTTYQANFSAKTWEHDHSFTYY